MRVDPDELRTGASQLYDAAGLAQEGAGKLSQVVTAKGIFGSFPSAESFHAAVSDAHQGHVTLLDEHQRRLGALGDKTHTAASAFVAMEDRNSRALREVLCHATQA
jgi:hypothetical protein